MYIFDVMIGVNNYFRLQTNRLLLSVGVKTIGKAKVKCALHCLVAE